MINYQSQVKAMLQSGIGAVVGMDGLITDLIRDKLPESEAKHIIYDVANELFGDVEIVLQFISDYDRLMLTVDHGCCPATESESDTLSNDEFYQRNLR